MSNDSEHIATDTHLYPNALVMIECVLILTVALLIYCRQGLF